MQRILRSISAITLMLLRLKLWPISSKIAFTSSVIDSTVAFFSSAVCKLNMMNSEEMKTNSHIKFNKPVVVIFGYYLLI